MVTEDELLFDEAERRLELEWRNANPASSRDVFAFYSNTVEQGKQLEAWHRQEGRQRWTQMVVDIARRSGLDGGIARVALDIGCGMGHDLDALREAGVGDVLGVEPSAEQRRYMMAVKNLFAVESVQNLPDDVYVNGKAQDLWESVDLIVCLDVMEHVPNPDAFLASWCSKARIGATLIERAATFDTTTPLHMNRGWHPGRTLDTYGWRLVEQDTTTGICVWNREKLHAPADLVQIVQCIYNAPSRACYRGMLETMKRDYRLPIVVGGEGLLPRARSMAFSWAWRETAADVFVNIDSDIGFTPDDLDRLVWWCRQGHDVVCAASTLHDGSAFGLQVLEGDDKTIKFGNDMEPMEIYSVSPGFMAVHRRVLDNLIPTLPLVHASLPMSFWPLFLETTDTIEQRSKWTGLPLDPINTMLSEDWAFSARCRAAGIKQWLARDLLIMHQTTVPLSVRNMGLVNQAIRNA